MNDVRNDPAYEAGYVEGLYGEVDHNSDAYAAGYLAGRNARALCVKAGFDVYKIRDSIGAEKLDDLFLKEKMARGIS